MDLEDDIFGHGLATGRPDTQKKPVDPFELENTIPLSTSTLPQAVAMNTPPNTVLVPVTARENVRVSRALHDEHTDSIFFGCMYYLLFLSLSSLHVTPLIISLFCIF